MSARRASNKRAFVEDEDDRDAEGAEDIEIAQVVREDHEDQDQDDDDEEFIREEIEGNPTSVDIRSNGDTIEGYEGIPSVKIIKVVPLPHARSEVWSYFGFMASDEGEIQDKKKAICKICATTLSYSGNTTNLFTHLKAMHPEAKPQKMPPTNKAPKTGLRRNKRSLYDIVSGTPIISLDTSSQSLPETPAASTSVIIRANPSIVCKAQLSSNNGETTGHAIKSRENNVSSDDVTNAVIDMLAKDCRPVSMVQGKGFEGLLRLLAPNYKLPDNKVLETMLKKRYEELRREFIIRGMDGNETN